MADLTRMYRCYNCQPENEFVVVGDPAAPVTCPKCSIDTTDPRTKERIVPLVFVHLEPIRGTVAARGFGTGEIACAPGKPAPDNATRTGEPSAVTCPMCKESSLYQMAIGKAKIDPRYDAAVVAIDPKGGLVFAQLRKPETEPAEQTAAN